MPKPTLDDEWKDKVRGILKVELARRNIKQGELVGMLEEAYGVKDCLLYTSPSPRDS